jgi:hypothetical protein
MDFTGLTRNFDCRIDEHRASLTSSVAHELNPSKLDDSIGRGVDSSSFKIEEDEGASEVHKWGVDIPERSEKDSEKSEKINNDM